MHHNQLLYTLVCAVSAGVAFISVAARLRIPAIAPLLVGGVALGPAGAGWVQPDSLGTLLEPLIGLVLAVILFEGGITLDRQALQQAPRAIWRLITIGALLTWMLTATAAWQLFDMPLPIALMLGSLVIVTGPTVVNPLLRRIGLSERLHNVLHWEAVLIDPIGVFCAVLCLEALMPHAGSSMAPWAAFLLRLVAGLVVGAAGGLALDWLLRRRRVRRDQVNLVVLAGVFLLYGLSDLILPHTGILTVTTAGFLLGLRQPPELRRIQEFVLQLTELGIAILFMLLAANLDLSSFGALGWRGAVLIGLVILVIRPLVVQVCTVGSSMTHAERLFASWVAPRGIIAASMASIVAIGLEGARQAGSLDAAGIELIEPFVFAVIGATVLLQGSTAGLVARVLGVRLPERKDWLVIGGSELGRGIAGALRASGVNVCLIDRNATAIRAARQDGLAALQRDAFDFELPQEPVLASVGNVICVTANAGLNRQLAAHWSEELDPERVFTFSGLLENAGQRPGRAVDKDAGGEADGRLSPLAAERAIASGDLEVLAKPLSPGVEVPAGDHEIPLILVRDGAARPLPPGAARAGDTWIVLRRRLPLRQELFRAAVRLVPPPASMDEAYERLVDLLVARHPGLDRAGILEVLRERDRVVPPFTGQGITIPHAMSSQVDAPICVVGTLPEGMAGPTPREEPLVAIFLLISPANNAQAHLGALAQIAGVAALPRRLAGLPAAPDEAAILALLGADPRPTLGASDGAPHDQ